MKYTGFAFLSNQFARLPPPLSADLSRKTVLVTGANTGIGFEAAQHFARMRPKRLVLACRNQTKGLNAVARIEKETQYKAELLPIDQADFSSVLEFTRLFGDAPLDIAVLNAGLLTKSTERTEDGWEATLQVNHLSTSLLALLLTPNLRRATEESGVLSRLVIVASCMHYWSLWDSKFAEQGILSTLNSKPDMLAPHKYTYSKLLNVLFVRALSDRSVSPFPTVPTAVCPGFCASELGWREARFYEKAVMYLIERTVTRTSEQGARQLIWAALGPNGEDNEHVEDLKGAFVMHGGIAEPSDFVVSEEGKKAQDQAWVETIDVLSKITPKVREIIDRYYSR